MRRSQFDLASAREAAEALLSELGLDAFLFAVEYRPAGWRLRVECPTEDGRQVQDIALGDELPGSAERDAELRDRLLDLLKERLAACKRRSEAEQEPE